MIETEELVYSLESLIGNIGGTLGLFLGFSFMACWQVFEELWSAFKTWWNRRGNQNSRCQSEVSEIMLKRDKDIICFQSKVDTLNLIILDMEDKIKSMEHKLKSSNGNIRIYNYQQQNMDDKERDSNKESEV